MKRLFTKIPWIVLAVFVVGTLCVWLFGMKVPVSGLPDWLVGFGSTVVGTFIAAYLGIDLAFRREREKRDQDQKLVQASAIRRALFALTRAHSYIANVEKQFCVDVRADARLRLLMAPFLDPSWTKWNLDLPSVDFLLGTEYRDVMLELVAREASYGALKATMSKRSELAERYVQPAIEALREPFLDDQIKVDEAKLEAKVGLATAFSIRQASDEIVSTVAKELVAIEKTQRKLQEAAMALFPGTDLAYFARREAVAQDSNGIPNTPT